MNKLLTVIILCLLPVSELRGGIPLGLSYGYNPVFIYVICVAANLAVIPIVFFFLDYLHEHFMKIRYYRNVFEKHLERSRKRIENAIGQRGEFWALLLFVGIPLPITGAYTGTLVAWYLGIKRKKAYTALGLGVFIAGLVVSAVMLLGIGALDFLVKNGF